MGKPTYDELVDAFIDIVWQAAEHKSDDNELIGHRFLSAFEDAFATLEVLGRLEYVDPQKCYWARIIWPNK